jgi:hypothetical protein
VWTHADPLGQPSLTDSITGDKTRQQKEDADRLAINKLNAGGSYVAGGPESFDSGNEEGLPVRIVETEAQDQH